MGRPLQSILCFIVFAAAMTVRQTCRADEPVYSDYELGVIERELARTGGIVDPNPEGKLITQIEVIRLEVFDETDPIPDVFNIFHGTTLEAVIRRELLFESGERFDSRRVDETARNLRLLRQLSLVLIVPLRGSSPNEVRILVITKDVWSLRLNWDFDLAGTQLNYLVVNPSEENVLGTHGSVGAMFVLLPHTYSTGLVVSHNRVMGTRISGQASYNLVFNRSTGENEGSYGSFLYKIPQYSVDQEWAFTTGILWSDMLARINVRNPGESSRTLFVYDSEHYVGGTEVTRSFGLAHKLDLSFGLEADRRAYRPRIPPGANPEAARVFFAEIPVSDTRISPFLQLESYETEFLKTLELETLGLQEDVRLGHEALLRVYPASTDLGSSRDLVGVLAGASYTVALGDGLARVIATSSIEHAGEQKHQTLRSLSVRLASPRLGFGRLVLDGFLADRGFNYLNRRYALGGDNRLRGYPPGSAALPGGETQRGADALVVNTELRTPALNILSAQCGLAAFYDVGDAADRIRELDLKQSLGLGARILFPQLDRVVFRLDWAMPLSEGYSPLPGALFITFEQAFPLGALGAPNLQSIFDQ